MPLYALGALGMPRRMDQHFEPSYVPCMIVAAFGAVLIMCALATLGWQLWISVRQRDSNRVGVGDPWNGRSLEWATSWWNDLDHQQSVLQDDVIGFPAWLRRAIAAGRPAGARLVGAQIVPTG